jgi:hypothetical protein
VKPQMGVVFYRHDPKSSVMIESVDRAAFYQLKTMLQGVVARGTARAISGLSPYVAGKTGTSDDENDAWFVGFTNDVTVAVWMGYDNADGKRRTLGGGSTGGGVAVPIFEPVIQAVWANVAPRTALAPPSPEAKRQLACKSIDLESGEMQTGGGKAITECLRVDGKGKVVDTQYRLVSQKSAYANRDREDNTPRTKVPSSTQPLGNYHGAYAFDNNGRYVYTPDLRRGVAQPAPRAKIIRGSGKRRSAANHIFLKHSSQGKICHVTRGTRCDPQPWDKCTERHHDAEPDACRLVHGVGDIYRDIGSFNSRDLAIEPRSPCVKAPLSRCQGVKANFHRAALVGCPSYGFCAPGRTRTRKYRHRSLAQLSGAFRRNPSVEISGCPMTRSRKSRMK